MIKQKLNKTNINIIFTTIYYYGENSYQLCVL
jgi:hypothetical protein